MCAKRNLAVWAGLKGMPAAPTAPRFVLFCGPSNPSVDIMCAKLLELDPAAPVVRVYSRAIERQKHEPLGRIWRLLQKRGAAAKQHSVPEEIHQAALHVLVRTPGVSLAAEELLRTEAKIDVWEARAKESPEGEREVRSMAIKYFDCLKVAEKDIVKRRQIILCTCTAAGVWGPIRDVLAGGEVEVQVVVDECGQALEPEVLVPALLAHRGSLVVLGDHKQLPPVVPLKDEGARALLGCSLLQRLAQQAHTQPLMLAKQYRMHPLIAKFASEHSYGGKMVSDESTHGLTLATSCLRVWPGGTPLAFMHSEGPESRIDRRAWSNAAAHPNPDVCAALQAHPDSCANLAEAQKVISCLLSILRSTKATKATKATSIFIITPYNAQQALLNALFTRCSSISGVEKARVHIGSVHSIQGDQADMVIISTVRSTPGMACLHNELQHSPRLAKWLQANLGFAADDHMLNVAVTRTRHGVLLIGNRHLLGLHQGWAMFINACSQL